MAKKRRAKERERSTEKGKRGEGETRREDAEVRVWDRGWFPVALFGVLSLLYFSEFVFSDKVVFGYDVGLDFHQGEGVSFGEKLKTLAQPMWNPQMGGFPQSEEIRPQYFPTYLFYLFTTYQRHLGWRYILTMLFAGWGMFAFMREIGVRRWAAVWVGVAYMSAPTFLAFPYAGHYAKMGVIALFPWMFFLLERGMERRRLIHFVGLGVTLGLGIYSPHPQMLYQALLGLGLYFLFKVVRGYQAERDLRMILPRAGLFTFAVALGLALGAEGAFPLYTYTRTESKRAGGPEGSESAAAQLARARSWSLHPEEVGSLVVPEFGGFNQPKEGRSYYWGRNGMKDNSEYFGVLVLLLALAAVLEARRQPLILFMGGLFVLTLAYTLGGHTPVHWLAFHLLPGVKVMRTTGMAAFIFSFAACALAGMGLSRIMEVDGEEREALNRRLLIVGGMLTGIGLVVAVAPRGVTDFWNAVLGTEITAQKLEALSARYGSGYFDWLSRGGLYGALVSGAGTVLLYLQGRGKLGTFWLIGGLCVLALFDTWRIDRVFLKYEDPDMHPDIRKVNGRTVAFLQSRGEQARIFPVPDYRLLESRPEYHLHGVPMVTGFNNLTIRRYDRLLREFDPVVELLKARHYAGSEVPYSDEALLEAVGPLLDLLNARYVVAHRAIELRTERFPHVFTGEQFNVYENRKALPWFYLARSYRMVEDEEQVIELLKSGSVDPQRTAIVERRLPVGFEEDMDGDTDGDQIEQLDYDPPDGYIRLRVNCDGPRLLVVSENYHSNWSALIDGRDADMYRVNYVWKAVPVGAGEHVVEFRYHSQNLTLSRLASILGLLIALGASGWEVWRRHRDSG